MSLEKEEEGGAEGVRARSLPSNSAQEPWVEVRPKKEMYFQRHIDKERRI